MTILLIFLMTAAIILFISKARNPSAYWMGSMLIGWFLSMAGLILFIAKYGGFYYKVNTVLFFNDEIRNLLLHSPIKIGGVSRMITVGRSLFIFSLIGLSVSLLYYRPFKSMWKIYALNLILPIANILFYEPAIYKMALVVLERKYTYMIGWITRGWIVISAVVAISMMIWKYRKVTVPWVKKQGKFILLGVFTLVLFYFYLGFMGPLQVFDVRTYYVLYSDFSNFNPPLTVSQWYLSIVFTGVLSLVSLLSIWRYAEVEMKMGKADMQLERKLKTANMGARVFTHAIKNQLIMIQLLIRQAAEQRKEAEQGAFVPDRAGQAGGPLAQAEDIVGHTLQRLDRLYQSFKTNHLHLKPCAVADLIQETVQRLAYVPDNVRIDCTLPDRSVMVLVDVEHMTEAIHNVLTNAIEAIGTSPDGVISVLSYPEEKWVIIRIADNGPGIPEHLQETVFDPFYTSKNTTKNWGVGLSYVKHVVLGHYGRIHLSSKPDAGSTFQLIIPLYVLKEEL